MEYESRIAPVLGHLAWLAERIPDPANDGRAHDAALLTYNAAAMLQWRFVAPVSHADTVFDETSRREAAEVIDDLVRSSRTIVTRAAKVASAAEDTEIREQLSRKINKAIKDLGRLMPQLSVTPDRQPELEEAANLRELMDEFLAAHADEYAAAIATGKAMAAKSTPGPETALNHAFAVWIYSQDAARRGSLPPDLQSGIARIAAGLFKTAVGMQSNDVPPDQKRQLARLADLLVAEAQPVTPR